MLVAFKIIWALAKIFLEVKLNQSNFLCFNDRKCLKNIHSNNNCFFNEKEEVTVSVEVSLIFNKNLISENDTFTACTIKN